MTATYILPEKPHQPLVICGDDNESLKEKLAANNISVTEFDLFWMSLKRGYTTLDNGIKIKIGC